MRCCVLIFTLLLCGAAAADTKELNDAALLSIRPTDTAPVVVGSVDGNAIRQAWKELLKGDLGSIGRHPLADDFPGAVSADAPRVTRSVTIDPATPRWHSTGLYAAAGEVITVTAPAEAVSKGIKLRIGAHKDELWNYKPDDKWKRFPALTVQQELGSATTRLACPFGGMVYVDVPSDCKLDRQFDLTVAGAVEAPLFVLGTTDVAAWKSSIRSAPAPWAELAGNRVIFTVPADAVRSMDDPTELLVLWDKYLDACSDLAGRTRERKSPERFVFDRQISAGWMHAGYPIMAHLASVKEVTVMKEVQEIPWGPLHELGHNHQQPAWTNGFNGEVSCNFFPLYVRRQFLGQKIGGHPSLDPKKAYPALAKIFALPADKREPDLFQRLWMYDAIGDAFGYDNFTAMWKLYDALPKDQYPKGDVEENTQWLIRMSTQVKHNLAPYVKEWNFPADYSKLGEIEALPVWMPEGFPQCFSDGQKKS